MSHTLLLADDSVTTQRVLELTFAEHGVRVVGVADGELALERLRTGAVDIVLADIGLAKINGYELAARIKQDAALAALPVLLLTGAFDTVDEDRVRYSGAAGTLVKPLESGFVIKRVKELLGIPGIGAAGTSPGRLVTPADESPQRPPARAEDAAPPTAHPVPPPRDAHIPVPQPAWDQLREQTGLAPDTAPAESGQGDDYFDRLDAAFDSLDAQLASTSGKAPARPPAPPAPAPAPAPVSTSTPAPVASPTAPAAEESMGMDDDWFENATGAGTPAKPVAPVAPPPAPARTDDVSFAPPAPPAPVEPPAPPAPSAPAAPPALAAPDAPHAPDAPGAPSSPSAPISPSSPSSPLAPAAAGFSDHVTMVASASHVADAFESLLAAEQGEIQAPQGTTIEISDDVIERIAMRVAEHLSGSVLIETVRSVAGIVTERLVKEEIERIRSAARERKS